MRGHIWKQSWILKFVESAMYSLCGHLGVDSACLEICNFGLVKRELTDLGKKEGKITVPTPPQTSKSLACHFCCMQW